MRELIRHILREQVSEKYLIKLLDYIKKNGLTIKSVGGGITLARRDRETNQIELVNKRNIAQAVIDRDDPYLNTYLAGYSDDDIIKILSEVAGKNPNEVSNILDLQSDSNGSVFMIYESPKLYLVDNNMKAIPSSIGENIIFIRDKVWFDGRPSFSGINNLSRLKNVDCDLWVGVNLDYIGGLEKVKGSLSFSGNDIKLIDTIVEVGELNIHDGNVKSLGSIKKCYGKCRVASNCEDLGDLEFVGGDLFIQSSNLISTGKVKIVKGNLRIRNTNVVDFPNLEIVEGKILVSRTMNPNIIKGLKDKGFNVSKG